MAREGRGGRQPTRVHSAGSDGCPGRTQVGAAGHRRSAAVHARPLRDLGRDRCRRQLVGPGRSRRWRSRRLGERVDGTLAILDPAHATFTSKNGFTINSSVATGRSSCRSACDRRGLRRPGADGILPLMVRQLSRRIPLAELHHHLGGAITPSIMWGIAPPRASSCRRRITGSSGT